MCKNSILDICKNDYNDFLNKSNVLGVGYGFKNTGGVDTKIECVKVLVEKKLPLNSISLNDLVPSNYNNILTDVIEVGKISSLTLTSKVRPIIGGYSIGPEPLEMAGTLGCLCANLEGTEYILSNNHVLSGKNTLPINTPILQPGTLDSGNSDTDIIATLSNYIPINFSPSQIPNLVDCAIAKTVSKIISSKNIYNIGNIKGLNIDPSIGLSVMKSSRSSGYTKGKVLATGATVSVTYSGDNVATFTNQIITSIPSLPGDSGALILDSNNFAVGLLFSGSSTITACNPIIFVLGALGVGLL